MTPNDGRADDAPDQNANGSGSESPEEGAAAQRDAEDAASTADSPTGEIA
ncbi:hypothetical protein [uncultured Microbacterium sp.]|nr:hypothetical protein [uncultured Microbacterium sp.]